MTEKFIIERFSHNEFWDGSDFTGDRASVHTFDNKQQAKTVLDTTVQGGWYGDFDIKSIYRNPAPAALAKEK